MKVFLQPPNAQDDLYLIRLENLIRIVDHWDLAQRNSETIEDAYHDHWFCRENDGSDSFHAPEFFLLKGIVRFINGRHRTLMLRRHLKELPMALTNMDGYPLDSPKPSPESIKALAEISIRKLSGQEVFDFPDLPVRYLGYDHNIGK